MTASIGIRLERRIPICWSHARFSLSPGRLQRYGKRSSAKARTQTGLRKSSTVPDAASGLLEKTLTMRGLPQGIVAVEVRREPTPESFRFEYGPMDWVVIRHCP